MGWMELLDMTGRSLHQESAVFAAGAQNWELDMNNFPAGLYYVVLRENQSLWQQQIMKA